MGRYTKIVSHAEDPDVVERVRELAEQAGTTPSAWIRQATRERLREAEWNEAEWEDAEWSDGSDFEGAT